MLHEFGTKIVTNAIRNRAGEAEAFQERSGTALEGKTPEQFLKEIKTLAAILRPVPVKHRKHVVQKGIQK